MGLLLFFVLVIIAVILHEFGHYLMARKCGVIADEFNIGMGPKICGKKWKGTEWNLRILPFGGSCVMDDSKVADLKSIDRVKIFFAGPLVNLVLSLVAFVAAALLAQNYNIFAVLFSWCKNVVLIVPTFFTSLVNSLSASAPTLSESGKVLENVISEQTSLIGTVIYLHRLFFSLNAFLFIGNILPIPALDGGQIALELPGVFGKPLSPKKVAIANWVFYILLMGVSGFYLIKDVVVTIIRA